MTTCYGIQSMSRSRTCARALTWTTHRDPGLAVQAPAFASELELLSLSFVTNEASHVAWADLFDLALDGNEDNRQEGRPLRHARRSQHESKPTTESEGLSRLLRQRRQAAIWGPIGEAAQHIGNGMKKGAEKTVEGGKKVGEKVVEGGKKVGKEVKDKLDKVGDTMGDLYEKATDKILFIAENAIDTLEKAIDILKRGFKEWGVQCSGQGIGFTMDAAGAGLQLPSCDINLMGQKTTLFDFGRHARVDWPGPLKTVVDLGSEIQTCVAGDLLIEVDQADQTSKQHDTWLPKMDLGNAMNPMHPFTGQASGSVADHAAAGVAPPSPPPPPPPPPSGPKVITCLADKIFNQALYKMKWATVRKLGGYLQDATHGIEPLKTIAGAPEAVISLVTQIKDCSTSGALGILPCVAGKIFNLALYTMSWPTVRKLGGYLQDATEGIEPLKTIAGAPEAVISLVTQIKDCSTSGALGILPCVAGKIFNLALYTMSWPTVRKLGGYLQDATEGIEPLKTIAGAPEAVISLVTQIKDCSTSGALGILPCVAGKIFNLALYTMSWPTVRKLGGYLQDATEGIEPLKTMAGAVKAVKSLVSMGQKVADECIDFVGDEPATSRAHDQKTPFYCLAQEVTSAMPWASVRQLGGNMFDVRNGVPPLSHLNRMGDILSDVLEGFAKVAATVAGQVLKGGASLIQEAALSKAGSVHSGASPQSVE